MGNGGEAIARRALGPAIAAAALALALTLVPRADAAGHSLQAQIRRTAHGIPHILAGDWGGAGFGYGYAFAQDNICTIADSYVTVRGERSRYFGPDAGYVFRGNGISVNNLNSDFFFKRIIDKGTVEKLLAQPPPNGPRLEVRDAVAGYVAGYNKYLADTRVDNIPDPRCRGAAWVKPITEMDAYRRFYQLALLASSGVAIDGIAAAQPPLPGDPLPPPPGPGPGATARALQRGMAHGPLGGIGSNAYGLGSQATSNGRGVVLANPHFPWYGSERFYQAQITIPGKLDVSGASLYGVPVVLIGHTDNLAWSHTVSTAYRFTPFQETINPLNPTQYLYDGSWLQMNRDRVTVMTKTASGIEPRSRTLYSTKHGPMFTSLVGVTLPWTPATAFSMGDANAGNFRYLNHFFETDQAQSVVQLDQIERRYQGIPWVNTIAADSAGKAYYADIGAIPNVTDAKAAACDTALGAVTFAALRLPILDGSRSSCEWGNDPDAIQPGTFGPSHEPSLFRDDYVTNSNDSYWLSNPNQPLQGFPRIIGDERTARSLRTRLGLRIVQQRLDGSDGLGSPHNFDRQQVQDAVFNDRQYAGELWRDQLLAMCRSAPAGFLPGSNGPVNVSAACPALAAWNLHDNLDSAGAILFRRFATRALASPLPVGDPSVFSTPFSATDPVNTPSGLNTASPKVQMALADAVTDLRSAAIPLNAPLNGYQFATRGSEKIPIHGGPGVLGDFNAINVPGDAPSFIANHGYADVPHGSSFVMVTQFTSGCPDDRSILTYSQSENPASPYFADQTRMFSNKQWVDPPFCENEILSDPSLRTTAVSGCLPEGCGPGSTVNAAKARKKCKRHRKQHHRKHAHKRNRCRHKHRHHKHRRHP